LSCPSLSYILGVPYDVDSFPNHMGITTRIQRHLGLIINRAAGRDILLSCPSLSYILRVTDVAILYPNYMGIIVCVQGYSGRLGASAGEDLRIRPTASVEA
jgi:hypothetical protein